MKERRNNRIYEDYVICRTYDKVRSGEYKNFSPHFFSRYDKQKKIIILYKYYVEDILGFTPEEALEKVTYKMLEKDKLKVILRHVRREKPDEYLRDKHYVKHLAYIAYPELVKPKANDLVRLCYKEVLDGTRRTFPKNYFNSIKGEERAKICFEYLWKEVLEIDKTDIPSVFLQSNEQGLQMLQKYKLKILTQMLYYSVSDMIQNMYPEMDLTEIAYEEE